MPMVAKNRKLLSRKITPIRFVAADHPVYQVLIPENSRFPCLLQRQHRLSGITYSRPMQVGAGVLILKDHIVAILMANSTPGVSSCPPVSSAPMSCGKGNRLALHSSGGKSYRYLSNVPTILLSVVVFPEKAFCPIPAACFGVGTFSVTLGHFVPKSVPCGAFSTWVFFFG